MCVCVCVCVCVILEGVGENGRSWRGERGSRNDTNTVYLCKKFSNFKQKVDIAKKELINQFDMNQPISVIFLMKQVCFHLYNVY